MASAEEEEPPPEYPEEEEEEKKNENGTILLNEENKNKNEQPLPSVPSPPESSTNDQRQQPDDDEEEEEEERIETVVHQKAEIQNNNNDTSDEERPSSRGENTEEGGEQEEDRKASLVIESSPESYCVQQSPPPSSSPSKSLTEQQQSQEEQEENQQQNNTSASDSLESTENETAKSKTNQEDEVKVDNSPDEKNRDKATSEQSSENDNTPFTSPDEQTTTTNDLENEVVNEETSQETSTQQDQGQGQGQATKQVEVENVNDDDYDDDDDDGEDDDDDFDINQNDSFSQQQQQQLPSVEARMYLYRKIESLVNRRINSIQRLPDTRPRDWLGRIDRTLPHPSKVGLRGRQISGLRINLVPAISAALLLPVEVTHDHNLELPEKPKQGLECISLLISNIVLLSNGNYDARVRNVIKTACVEMLEEMYQDEDELEDSDSPQLSPSKAWYLLTKEEEKKQVAKMEDVEEDEDEGHHHQEEGDEQQVVVKIHRTAVLPKMTPRKVASMRFEHLEKAIATDILKVLVEKENRKQQALKAGRKKSQQTKEILYRGLQIGTVSLFVGGLFAVTGGLAGPALVAAITAFGTGIGSTAVFAALTTTTALATMFGVAGGGLAAYKMKKRTDGLSEWRIRKENSNTNKDVAIIRGLHATVGVSGWIADKSDFQRPWGITPDDPQIAEPSEILQRFFTVNAPEKLRFCKALLKAHKKNEKDLWEKLQDKYGADPERLVPFDKSGEPHVVSQKEDERIDGFLNSQVLDDQHAKNMEEIYQSNKMLLKMEMMNAETFAKMNDETIEMLTRSEEQRRKHQEEEEEEEATAKGGEGVVAAEGVGEEAEGNNHEESSVVETNLEKQGSEESEQHDQVNEAAPQDSEEQGDTPQKDDTTKLLDGRHDETDAEHPDLLDPSNIIGIASSDMTKKTGNAEPPTLMHLDTSEFLPVKEPIDVTPEQEQMLESQDEPDEEEKTEPIVNDKESAANDDVKENETIANNDKQNNGGGDEDETSSSAETEECAENPTKQQDEDTDEAKEDLELAKSEEDKIGADLDEKTAKTNSVYRLTGKWSWLEVSTPKKPKNQAEEEEGKTPERITVDDDDETSDAIELSDSAAPKKPTASFGMKWSSTKWKSSKSFSWKPATPMKWKSNKSTDTETTSKSDTASSDPDDGESILSERPRKSSLMNWSSSTSWKSNTSFTWTSSSTLKWTSTRWMPSSAAAAEKKKELYEVADMESESGNDSKNKGGMEDLSYDTKDDGLGDDDDDAQTRFTDENSDEGEEASKQENKMDNQHTLVVWDWEAAYGGELYTVTWETNFLLNLCRVVEVLFFEISNQVSKEVLKQTLIGGLVSAVAIPSALTTATGVIDDPYQLISFRSEKAGIELAHCLLSSEERRPVSLVGFSFGARVIFQCLLELERHQALWEERRRPKKPKAEEKKEREKASTMKTMFTRKKKTSDDTFQYNREPASIVEDVVLIGMPRLIERKEWIRAREIVAGRLVNCYNRNDWVVSYMINVRCWNGIRSTCGTHEIDGIEGVENYEVSEFATSHGRYVVTVPHILHHVGFGQPGTY